MYLKKTCSIAVGIFFASVLTSCTLFESPIDSSYRILENTVKIEIDFYAAASPTIVELETNEIEIYNELMKLHVSESAKIKELVDQGIANASARKDYIQKENKMFSKSKDAFSSFKGIISKLEVDQQSRAIELQTLNLERYSLYEEVYTLYVSAIEQDNTFYELMLKPDLDRDTLDDQLEKTNAAYNAFNVKNDEFNAKTNLFNEKKRDFYTFIGIKIQ